jgi:hypothetical protein
MNNKKLVKKKQVGLTAGPMPLIRDENATATPLRVPRSFSEGELLVSKTTEHGNANVVERPLKNINI